MCSIWEQTWLPNFSVLQRRRTLHHEKIGHKIIGYIDDYVGFGIPSDAKVSFDCLYGLLQELGLSISTKKLIPSITVVTCLGIQVDTEKGTLSIPTEKNGSNF